jgi:hypothetical protein
MRLRSPKKSRSEIPGQSCRALPGLETVKTGQFRTSTAVQQVTPNVLPVGLADADSGVLWWLFPDLLALDRKAEWLERMTGKRNL